MLDIKSINQLLEEFSNGLFPIQKFCDEYIKLFASIEAGEIDANLFHILEDLFEDIDAYSPMWTPDDEAKFPYRITEPTLRLEAQKSFIELEEYMFGDHSNQKDEPS